MLIEGVTISNFVFAEFVQREIGFVLPREEHIADAALREGGGRSARAGIEHRNIFIELASRTPAPYFRRHCFSSARSPKRPDNVQRAPPELLGFGVITPTPGLTRSSQSLMCLGLPLRTRNTMVEV